MRSAFKQRDRISSLAGSRLHLSGCRVPDINIPYPKGGKHTNPWATAVRSSVVCRAIQEPADEQQLQENAIDVLETLVDPTSWSITPAAGVSSWSSYQKEYEDDGYHWPPQQRKTLPSYSLTKDVGSDIRLLEAAASDIAQYRSRKQLSGSSSRSSSKRNKQKWFNQLKSLPGWLLYRYYKWRQDGVSDLLLITAMSSTLLVLAAMIKRTLIDPAHDAAATVAVAAAAAAASASSEAAAAAASAIGGAAMSSDSSSEGLGPWLAALGTDMYQVLVLAFGENLPNPYETGYGPAEGLFSVSVSLTGLAGFAVTLALVEQVVLETNMANVKRGSQVYESGHYLLLGWAVSQRDLEVLIKLVGQLCGGAAAEGGATIVVLTQREKLEMEELFRRALPASARAGSRLVFRQGSPLLPADLSNVAASQARATIIVSDQSRSRDEADAQSLRCAILLDELDDYKGLRKGRALGHIVVETRTANAVPLLRFSCSKRVIAMPTVQFNAARLARMVKKPFISWLSQRLLAFDSKCALYIQAAPELTGQRFRYLPFYYPDAVILGVAHLSSGQITLNPLLDYTLQPDDELVLCKRRLTIPPASGERHIPHLSQLLSIPQLEQLGQEELKAQEQQERELAMKDWKRKLLLRVEEWLQQVQDLVLSRNPPEQQQLSHRDGTISNGTAAAASDVSAVSNSKTLAVQSIASIGSLDGDAEEAAAAAVAAAAAAKVAGEVGSRMVLHQFPSVHRAEQTADSSNAISSNGNGVVIPANNAAAQHPIESPAAALAAAAVLEMSSSMWSSNGKLGDEKVTGQDGSSSSNSSVMQPSSSDFSLKRPNECRCVAYNSAVLSDNDDLIEECIYEEESVQGDFTTAITTTSSSSAAAMIADHQSRTAGAADASAADSFDDEDDIDMTPGLAHQHSDIGGTLEASSTSVAAAAASHTHGVHGTAAATSQPVMHSTSNSSSSSSSDGVGEHSDVTTWAMLGSDTMDSIDITHSSSSSVTNIITSLDSVDSQTRKRPSHTNLPVVEYPSITTTTSSSSSDSGASMDERASKHRDLAFSSTAEDRSSAAAAASYQAGQQQATGIYWPSSDSSFPSETSSSSPSAAAAASVSSPPPSPLGGSSAEGDLHSKHSSFDYVPREYLAVDSSPQAVLVAGWSDSGFMAELLRAFDQGSSCLPPGSEILFVNNHPPDTTLGVLLRGRTLSNVKVSHVHVDPLQRSQLSALPLARFRAAVVLADERWVDPDMDDSNGIDSIDQPSLLRQDALMVMVQLNIRQLLEELALPPINIICQKVGTQGLTRFEDRRRLPLGISVNFNSMAAKLLTQVAMNPLSMLVITGLGGGADLTIVDSSEYCGRGEAMSFWRVLLRAQAAGDVLLGYYILPTAIDQPIESTINPQGLATRSKRRIWNTGDGRLKFMIIRDKEEAFA